MNREQRRAHLNSKPKTQEDRPITTSIGVNQTAKKVVVIYSAHVNNVGYTIEQVEHHIRGLLAVGKVLDPAWEPNLTPLDLGQAADIAANAQ